MSPNCKVAELVPSLPRTSLALLLDLTSLASTKLPVFTTKLPEASFAVKVKVPPTLMVPAPIERPSLLSLSFKDKDWVLRVPPFDLWKTILFSATPEPDVKSSTLSSASMSVSKVSTTPPLI